MKFYLYDVNARDVIQTQQKFTISPKEL